MIRRRYARASLTVESAFIVPMAVIILALLMILLFYFHNYVWYTGAACEAAIRGNMPVAEGSGEASDEAEQLLRRKIKEQVMPGTAPEGSVTVKKNSTAVQIQGQRYAMFQSLLTPFSVKVNVDQVRPETYVRLLWAGRRS